MMTESYNPKWQVEVDDKPAKLLRCDFILRGVYLEPGKHKVVFRFVNPPGTLFIGVASIVLGLALCCYLGFNKSPEEEKPPAAPAEPEKPKTAAKQK
jgi:uncharacterized membrane protein YfhO